MKLVRLVVLLLLANAGFFAWSQGWLDGLSFLRAQPEREPERLARQFQPHLLRVVTAGSAPSGAAVAPAPAPTPAAASGSGAQDALACVEAGPYGAADAAAAEALLLPLLPTGSLTRRTVERPGVWLVYAGRYIAADALQRKIDEMRRLQVPFDEVTAPPDLAPGLSLGRFESRQAAEQALERLTQRGVRAARVVLLTEPSTRIALRIERADAALVAQLAGLPGSVAGQPLAQAFKPC
ncbi:MAG: hypothetical protein KA151_00650 [Piscinibacter sp.]|nr:hypothetical protein [Piscinibacter sp.]